MAFQVPRPLRACVGVRLLLGFALRIVADERSSLPPSEIVQRYARLLECGF